MHFPHGLSSLMMASAFNGKATSGSSCVLSNSNKNPACHSNAHIQWIACVEAAVLKRLQLLHIAAT